MSKQTEVIDVSDLGVDDILQLIDASGPSGKGALDPEQYWLTADVACEYLRKELLGQSEVMALLSGLNPITAGVYGCESYLDPQGQDIPAAGRMLNDINTGRVGMPMTTREFVTWCQEWQIHIPDPLCDALVLIGDAKPDEQVEQQSRKNSAADALKEVKRCMEQAYASITAVNLDRTDGKIPGTKAAYLDYLRDHSGRLHDLGDDRLEELLKQAGYKWSQSGKGRAELDVQIRKALGLTQDISQAAPLSASSAMGNLPRPSETWFTKVPLKT